MSDMDTTQNQEGEVVDELAMLKQRAKMMGITFSNNIGLDSLRQKIEAKMAGHVDPEDAPVANPLVDPAAPVNKSGKTPTLRQHLINEEMKLIRLRITNLDPKKKGMPGDFFTVANEHLGTITKYVPFGEATDEGYHVPHCIYKMLKAKKFLDIRTYKDKSNGNAIKVEQRWAAEFALEVLPPLTHEELKQLAVAQTAAGNS
jgi:hypothetical protein